MTEMRHTRELLRCPMKHLIQRPEDCRWCADIAKARAEVDAMEAVAAQLRNVLARTPDRPYCKGGLTTCEDCRGSCGIEDAPDALARLDALGEQT